MTKSLNIFSLQRRCFCLSFDSKLVDCFVNSVGNFGGTKIEFTYATWCNSLKVSQSHIHHEWHSVTAWQPDVPRGVRLSGCSARRSCASKESSGTLLNSHNNRMKSIGLERLLCGYSILSCRRNSNWFEGIRVKTCMDANWHAVNWMMVV